MSIMTEMKVRPWTVPNFITLGTNGEISIAVKHAVPELVRAMVQQFMKDAYDKAGMAYDWRFE